MNAYHIRFYQNGTPRRVVMSAIDIDDLRNKFIDFQKTEEIYRGKVEKPYDVKTIKQWDEEIKSRRGIYNEK